MEESSEATKTSTDLLVEEAAKELENSKLADNSSGGNSNKSDGEYFIPSVGQSLKMNVVRPKPGEIAEEEAAAVERLKDAFLREYPEPSKCFTNTCFLRFYRGMKKREEAALDKLLKFQKWRLENDVDSIMNQTDKFSKPLNSGLTIFGGKDKKGRPFSYNYAFKHNAYDRDINEMRMFIIYSAEYMVSLANPDEERFCIYFDLNKFSMSCMDYEVVKSLVDILQNNYQETLETLFVIDAPFIFSACWAIIKGWLDPITAAKVQFIRRAQIADTLDESVIPPIAA